MNPDFESMLTCSLSRDADGKLILFFKWNSQKKARNQEGQHSESGLNIYL